MNFPYEVHFLVCTGGRCNAPERGDDDRGEPIRTSLKDLNRSLGRKETVRVCAVSCLDLCDEGPNIVVWPSGNLYTGQTKESAREVYEKETASLRESEER